MSTVLILGHWSFWISCGIVLVTTTYKPRGKKRDDKAQRPPACSENTIQPHVSEGYSQEDCGSPCLRHVPRLCERYLGLRGGLQASRPYGSYRPKAGPQQRWRGCGKTAALTSLLVPARGNSLEGPRKVPHNHHVLGWSREAGKHVRLKTCTCAPTTAPFAAAEGRRTTQIAAAFRAESKGRYIHARKYSVIKRQGLPAPATTRANFPNMT